MMHGQNHIKITLHKFIFLALQRQMSFLTQ